MATVSTTNAPEIGLPTVDWGSVSYIGDGTEFFRCFRYVHRKHTLKDILRPGYWNPVPSGKKDQVVALQPWDEVSFCVDGPNPCDATRGLLVIETKVTRRGEDVIVGLVMRDKATKCGHDGTETKAEDKERKAA